MKNPYTKKSFAGYLIAATMITAGSCAEHEPPQVPLPQTPSEDVLHVDNEPRTRGISNGTYNSLGVSYDLSMGVLNDEATKFPVINIPAFLADYPGSAHEHRTNSGKHEFYSGANAIDYSNEVIRKVTAGASAGAIGGDNDDKDKNKGIFSANISYNGDFHNKNTYSSKYSYSRAELKRIVRRTLLDVTPEVLQNYLLPNVTRDLNVLTPENFVKKYGTHVLLDVTIGGKYTFDYRSEIYETEDMSDKKNIVEAGAKFSIAKIVGVGSNASFSSQTITKLNEKNASWQLNVKYVGGTNSGISQSFNSETGYSSSTINYSAWESSVTYENGGVVDINWKSTYYIYEFIADPTKRAQIKSAVDKYLQGAKIVLVDVKPLYRLHQTSTSNTFFSTSLNEVSYYINRWGFYLDYGHQGYETHYIQGYVFETRQPGTVPLYRLYGSGIQNTHLTISHSEATHLVNNVGHQWDYGHGTHYILGYVYPAQTAGCVPFYRLYSAQFGNTFMTTSYSEALQYISRPWGYKWYERLNDTQGYLLTR